MPTVTPKEATVIISGYKLTFAESMTLRVAIGSFLMSLASDGLGDDTHGKEMTRLYKQNASTIQKYIMEEAK